MPPFRNDGFLHQERQPSGITKDDACHYLSECGVKACLNEIFAKMLNSKEKPENPMDFIRTELGVKPLSKDIIRKMEEELEIADREVMRLRQILHGLEAKGADLHAKD